MIDLKQSRRTKFVQCQYWSQLSDPDIVKFNELAYEKEPNGFFKASIVGSFSEENQTLENAFMYKKTNVVVETTDNVRELERNDLVKMKGKMYRVEDIQRTPVQKQQQFLKDEYVSYTTYISLRG